MDCLSSEDLKGRKRNSLCLTAYTESECCQVGNVPSLDALATTTLRSRFRRALLLQQNDAFASSTCLKCLFRSTPSGPTPQPAARNLLELVGR